ncbi:hypothetical protein IVB36_20710 [Bradyrhizobium sp. 35]|uniref:hypothetical protein n=1 Tax=Bradyrhizobium sp. 35 TaxID=2782670 RepID=UPI001FF82998|nr:hypothetical protein [Bradyrhizobium sp. 35]MCK1453243.1 hypothetical protein [Bradyrhizobium sp. 35]
MTTADEYLRLAERYRKALETMKDPLARQCLERMEGSYRTLADSERALRTSGYIVDALGKLGDIDKGT